MSTKACHLIAGATALLILAFLLEVGALRAETTNALTLNDCLRESLSANHTLLARTAERDAADSRARGSTAARLALTVGCADAPETAQQVRPAAAPPVAAPETVANTTQTIAYYFHGTVRCETCLQIEKQA